ncbi:MAG: MATE family efflux transporter [Clostridium sp.]
MNSLGTNTVAAWAAYSKLDSVFWMMINAFGISVTTFVGQNYGAGEDGPRASRRADLHGYDDSGISWHVVSHLPLWSLWV